MNSMESFVVVDPSFSAGKQMKKTPQNGNPHHYLHPIATVASNSPSRHLSQNDATPPQVMQDEYDKMMMMMMTTMHRGLCLNNQQHARAPYHHHHHHHHLTNSTFPPTMTLRHGPHQPPLHPFPIAISRPAFHPQPPLRRSQSLSPPVIVPRKASAKNKNPPKKENKKGHDNGMNNSVHFSSGKAGTHSKGRKGTQVSTGPTKGIGPNPDLTRRVSDVEMDGCAISPVFRMAPPPSSLPLPRFTLRKPPPPLSPMKLMRCEAKAVGVDAAATDNIGMLLKLR